MSQFDKVHMISYQCSTVTTALSCIITLQRNNLARHWTWDFIRQWSAVYNNLWPNRHKWRNP